MSVFTMSLMEAIEFHGEDKLGLDEYPVISEAYRTRINRNIIDEYLNREIAHESFSMFRHRLRLKMRQIMPVYNELYRTQTLLVDPLRTVDIQTLTTSTREGTTGVESTSESEGNTVSESATGSKTRNVTSDTPSVLLSDNGNYATNAADAKADGTANVSGTENASNTTNAETNTTETDVMDSRVMGYNGSQADLIVAFRNAIINVDMMIIAELEPLFMGVWNNGDSYTPRRYFA